MSDGEGRPRRLRGYRRLSRHRSRLHRVDAPVGAVGGGCPCRAFNYAFKGQKPAGVTFGEWKQAHPADFSRDLAKFTEDGGVVYALSQDVQKHGLSADDLIDGVEQIERDAVAKLVAEYDLVSFW